MKYIWHKRRLLRNNDWGIREYYYCNLWCFLTNRRFCKGISK